MQNLHNERDPKISVIIPIYNVMQWLPDCIESVQNNTYTNLEIICVNDGSTDGAEAYLGRISQQDSRIVVINKENGGITSARNAGMDSGGGLDRFYRCG